MVKELIKAGAKTDQPDKSGKTPADYARNKEIIGVLEDVRIAKKQGEFLEKLTVVSENTVASVIIAKEELETVDK